MQNNQNNLFENINIAVDFIRKAGYSKSPVAGLTFGSGLGGMSKRMEIELEIPYNDIPGFVPTTVDFHKGSLIFGQISGRDIVAMNGRIHYYEGYSMQQVTFPVRVMRGLGAKTLMLSSITGGVNPEFSAGDVVVIVDHINLMGDNPLIGQNDERLGTRYPDMIEPYSRRLVALAEKHARRQGLRLPRAVLTALSGPTFETRAEYRMLRAMGADIIGMSVVPETIAAIHGGMDVVAFSLVSDECFPECLQPIELEVLLKRAEVGSQKIFDLYKAVLEDKDFLPKS